MAESTIEAVRAEKVPTALGQALAREWREGKGRKLDYLLEAVGSGDPSHELGPFSISVFPVSGEENPRTEENGYEQVDSGVRFQDLIGVLERTETEAIKRGKRELSIYLVTDGTDARRVDVYAKF